MRMSRLLVAAIVVVAMVVAVPALAADTEINLGGGHPLWGTHSDDDTNGFDGMDSWLGFASIDKKAKDSKWLKYGLMYNYTRIKMHVEEETTTYEYEEYDREYQTCLECNDWPVLETTTTSMSYNWLSVHVLGPYAKPYWQISKRLSAFATVGGGLMYVDGKIYGNELGGAGFASAGLTFDIYKNFGVSGQMLYVKGFTKHVEDIDYYAPVVSFKYSF